MQVIWLCVIFMNVVEKVGLFKITLVLLIECVIWLKSRRLNYLDQNVDGSFLILYNNLKQFSNLYFVDISLKKKLFVVLDAYYFILMVLLNKIYIIVINNYISMCCRIDFSLFLLFPIWSDGMDLTQVPCLYLLTGCYTLRACTGDWSCTLYSHILLHWLGIFLLALGFILQWNPVTFINDFQLFPPGLLGFYSFQTKKKPLHSVFNTSRW